MTDNATPTQADLISLMNSRIQGWDDDEDRDDWWEYQREYAAAANTIATQAAALMATAEAAATHLKAKMAADAEIARLRELLRDARDNGLSYWEPCTDRGYRAKEVMVGAINAALSAHPSEQEGGE